jgi:hypothetical protein
MLVFFGSEKAPKFLERQRTWNRAPVKGPEVERDKVRSISPLPYFQGTEISISTAF